MSNNTTSLPAENSSHPRKGTPIRKKQREEAQQFINTLQGVTFPNSQRIYLQGSRPDIQVPMREIQLSPTQIGGSKNEPRYEDNEAIRSMTPPVPMVTHKLNWMFITGCLNCVPLGSQIAKILKRWHLSVPALPNSVWLMKAWTIYVLSIYPAHGKQPLVNV